MYQRYHDHEWARPVADDRRLFEKLCLEGFQSGLSWLTILRKRESFRRAFAGFDVEKVARFDDEDVARLLQDASIVRHRGKIEAAIHNARRVIDLLEEHGSLASFIWRFEPTDAERPHRVTYEAVREMPSTPASKRMSQEFKRLGFRFFGPTTAYSFMQAVGMVNDHLEGCSIRPEVESERARFERPS